MARTNLRIRYIEDRAARKAILNKRLQDLLQKVEELSILCGVQACVVFCSEDRDEALMHWPGDRGKVEEVLGRYLACPEEERLKGMTNVGNVGNISGVGNTGRVGDIGDDVHPYVNTGDGSKGPMIVGCGFNNFNVEATAENVPGAVTRIVGAASVITDAEGPNQGGGSVNLE